MGTFQPPAPAAGYLYPLYESGAGAADVGNEVADSAPSTVSDFIDQARTSGDAPTAYRDAIASGLPTEDLQALVDGLTILDPFWLTRLLAQPPQQATAVSV